MSTTPLTPVPTPETQEFWDHCNRDELWLQRCRRCESHYYFPRPVCPSCGTTDVVWTRVSGRASLYSYVINARPAPGFEDRVPYAIAVVELEEGPRMMTNIVGIDNTPENLVLDMALEVAFEDRGGQRVPVFAPTERGAA